MPDVLARLPVEPEARDPLEAQLIAMVLDGVTSLHSRRAYQKGLRLFFAWCREQSREQARAASFSKSLANAYRSWLLAQGLAPSTINLRLSPLRKLAREMADNDLLPPDTAAAIERVPGVKQEGVRAGNWLLKEQASELLNAPDPARPPRGRPRGRLRVHYGNRFTIMYDKECQNLEQVGERHRGTHERTRANQQGKEAQIPASHPVVPLWVT